MWQLLGRGITQKQPFSKALAFPFSGSLINNLRARSLLSNSKLISSLSHHSPQSRTPVHGATLRSQLFETSRRGLTSKTPQSHPDIQSNNAGPPNHSPGKDFSPKPQLIPEDGISEIPSFLRGTSINRLPTPKNLNVVDTAHSRRKPFTSFIIGTSLVGLGSIAAFAAYHRRFVNSFAVFFAIGWDYKYSLYGLPEGEEKNAVWRKVHERSAKKLVNLCDQNGGVFIKLGQHIAALWHILPLQYVEASRQLQDQVSYLPYQTVRKTIRADFGKNPEEMFDFFDPKPIASASLAQVHEAVLHGERVAVKVEYDGLKEQVEYDINLIATICDIATEL